MKKVLLFLPAFLFSLSPLTAQNASWTVYTTANSGIPDNAVIALEKDSADNIWIGTEVGGLALFDRSAWTIYNTLNTPMPANEVAAIAFEKSGVMWIGVDGGLLRRSGTQWTLYTPQNSGLPDVEVTAIAVDSNNVKWIGTEVGGLARFNDTAWTVYDTSNSDIPANDVIALAVDSSNRVWLGTETAGAAMFDGAAWTVYNTGNSSLPADIVLAIEVDSLNRKWIGTEKGGLAQFDDTVWTVYTTANSGLPSDAVLALHAADEGLWIGTEDGGAALFDGTNWTLYNVANSGLPSNVITAIVADERGAVWFGTEFNGLAKLCTGPPATITVTGSTAVCSGDTVWLSANAGNYSYQWFLNGQAIGGADSAAYAATAGGSYVLEVSDSLSCGTRTPAITVTIYPAPAAPVISQASGMLASTPGATYQWYLNNQLIPGATSQFYTPSQSGFYSVEITDANGCSAISSLFPFSMPGFDEPGEHIGLSVYPNPLHEGALTIGVSAGVEILRVEVLDALGKTITALEAKNARQVRVDRAGLAQGMYVVRVLTREGIAVRKVIVE